MYCIVCSFYFQVILQIEKKHCIFYSSRHWTFDIKIKYNEKQYPDIKIIWIEIRKDDIKMLDMVKQHELKLFHLLAFAKKIYSQNLKTILLITLVVFFPINIVLALLANNLVDIGASINLIAIQQNQDLLEKFMNSPELSQIMTYNTLYMIIQLFFAPLGIMAAAKVTQNSLNGEKIAYKEAILESFSKAGTAIISIFVSLIMTSIGFLCLFIPGIFLTVVWYFSTYAIMLSDKKAISSLGYSMNLVHGNFLKVLGTIIMILCLNYVVSYCLSYLFMWGMGTFAVDVLMRMVDSAISMFFYILIAVWYMNREFLFEKNKKQ